MDKLDAQEIIEKILNRDFDRWLIYLDVAGLERKNYKMSFPHWKEHEKFIEEDAKLIAELLAN